MDGRQQDQGGARTAEAPQGAADAPWLRQLRIWLDSLAYRPERRYMRGLDRPARPGAEDRPRAA
jgi:hypothetical protein